MKKNTAKDETANFDSRQFLKDGAVEKSLGIFGSRSLSDDRVKVLILEALNHGGYTKIISCLEPGGVSAVAREVAAQFGYPLQTHCLNLRYLRGAFEQRSMEVIALADAFLIIHDGKSKGTINEKILCEQSGKPIQYELLAPSPFKSSSGFIDEDWSVDWDLEELGEEFE
jgi:hypothetical protein